MYRIGRWTRRILTHLTRSKARVGWILIIVCASLYTVVRDDTVRQVALILASVAAGAIFLPELSSDLWTMRADQIRKIVPEQQVAQLQQELISASTDDLVWATYIWFEALSPMLAAVREPLQVQWHLTYDVRVYLDQTVEIDGERSIIHRLESLCRSERLLPPSRDSRVWVSLTRTHDALISEFNSSGCLLREHVDLPGVPVEKWHKAMLQLCRLNLTVNGRTIPLKVGAPDSVDIIRWEASLAEEDFGGVPVPVTVSISFPLSSQVTRFPIIFASYYCAGRTEISFAVHHPEDPIKLEFIDFCNRRAGKARSHSLVQQTADDGRLATVSFATPKGSVLWPGSGMLILWKTRSEDEVAR